MAILHQPHDHFAKASLKHTAIARDFFKAHLPQEILTRLDLTTLKGINKSYIASKSEALHSDIVYQCRIDGKEGYLPIILLVEHQSDTDEHMAFRLLQYTIHIMQDHLDAGYRRLPLVLPICLYHGTTSPYPDSTDIYDDFDEPELARRLVFQPFQLIDLSTLPIEKLKHDGLAAMMEILLKNHQTKNLFTLLQYLTEQGILSVVIEKTPQTYLTHVLNYIIDRGDHNNEPSADQLLELLAAALPKKRETIMTFREQLEKRGEQRGEQRGSKLKELAIAKKMLANDFDADTIIKITELTPQELDQLKET